MTAFLKWATETAAAIAMDDEQADRQVPSTLEQRIAIMLCQARALEMRYMSGQMEIHGLTQHPMLKGLAIKMHERSHKLEAIGLELCKTYPPPEDGPEEEMPALVTLQ